MKLKDLADNLPDFFKTNIAIVIRTNRNREYLIQKENNKQFSLHCWYGFKKYKFKIYNNIDELQKNIVIILTRTKEIYIEDISTAI